MEAGALHAPAGLSRISIGSPLLRLRSDDQLVAAFRAGNEEAFQTIFDRYRQRLFAYARQMLGGSRQDAEDALQDVFLRAYGALRASDRPVSLRAWLYRVAHNRCIDQLRRPVPAQADVFDLSRAPLRDPIEESQRREDLRRLVEDVQRLPEAQRSALLMREMDGLSYQELADALDVTVPAVKSLLVRARIGLVEAIEARDTACAEIRTDLMDAYDRGVRASGKARRHLRDCSGCRAYRTELRSLQRGLGALSPSHGPMGALLKLFGLGGGAGGAAASSGAVFGGGGAATVVGGGAATATACKVAVVVCSAALVTGAAGGIEDAVKQAVSSAPAQKAAAPAAPAPAPTPATHAATAPAQTVALKRSSLEQLTAGSTGSAHGAPSKLTPAQVRAAHRRELRAKAEPSAAVAAAEQGARPAPDGQVYGDGPGGADAAAGDNVTGGAVAPSAPDAAAPVNGPPAAGTAPTSAGPGATAPTGTTAAGGGSGASVTGAGASAGSATASGTTAGAGGGASATTSTASATTSPTATATASASTAQPAATTASTAPARPAS